MFQQHLAIFHKRRPLPVWFLHPWLSATNGFYRNYQELGGKMGGQKIILGGHLPPLGPPPLAPPLSVRDICPRVVHVRSHEIPNSCTCCKAFL